MHTHTHVSKYTSLILPQSPELWACLAGMSAASRELSTATIAYASINEVRVFSLVFFYLKLSLFVGGQSATSQLNSATS